MRKDRVKKLLINRETDYAVRIIHCLSVANSRMDANAISEFTGVSLRFSLKILRKLVAAGLINSFKGVHGGYELKKEPKDISIYDVFFAMNGELHINRCQNDYHHCEHPGLVKNPFCAFKSLFDGVEEDIRNVLRQANYENITEITCKPHFHEEEEEPAKKELA